jgi:hypothetical protein
MKYRVVGMVRLQPAFPGGKPEQVAVRRTVLAGCCVEAFELVRAEYDGRLNESDLTAEEVAQ